MALITNVIPQVGGQMNRIDDRVIRTSCFASRPVMFDMQLSRAMATLAADAVPREDRLPVSVQRVLLRGDEIRVAIEAVRCDRSIEVVVRNLVVGR